MSEQTLTTEQSAADVIALLNANNRSQHATDAALKLVTTAGGFLPYIQVMGGNSAEVKRGKFPIGHFSLVKNKKLGDIGESFIALLLSWRPKAMRYKPTVMSYFDVNNPEFQKIEDLAKTPNSNCGFGPEFLMWLPDYGEFATLFLGNITGRIESPNLIHCLEKGSKVCRLETHLIESKRNNNSWHGLRLVEHDLPVKYPQMADLTKVLESFNKPPESAVESAETESSDERK